MATKITQPDTRIWLQLLGVKEPMDPIMTAECTGVRTADAQEALERLVDGGHVVRYPVFPGECRARYAVTGTCLVPAGLAVAEVVAEALPA